MRLAKERDMADVYKNWEIGFGDTKEEIHAFFEAFGDKVRVCVWEEDGRIVGQLCLLPATLIYSTREKVQYIYAVTVHPDYRKQKIAARLIEAVVTLLYEEGSGAVLVPYDEKMEKYYAKCGFTRCFPEQSFVLEQELLRASETVEMQVKELRPKEYIELRKEAFAEEETPYVEQDEPFLLYALDLHKQEKGKCAEIMFDGQKLGVLYREEKQDGEKFLVITEITSLSDDKALDAARMFMAYMHCKRGILIRSYVTYGIGLSADFSEGYFNLVLD